MSTEVNQARDLSTQAAPETADAPVKAPGAAGNLSTSGSRPNPPKIRNPRIGRTTVLRAQNAVHLLAEHRRINGRDAFGRRYRIACEQLTTAMGGETNVSPQRAALIRIVAVDLTLLESIDAYIARLASPINGGRRRLHNVVDQRSKFAAGVVERLKVLGLDRVAAPVLSLREQLLRDQTEREARERNGTELVP